MTKWGKTGFTRLHWNFGSTVSQEKKKYLDLKKFGPEAVHKRSRSSSYVFKVWFDGGNKDYHSHWTRQAWGLLSMDWRRTRRERHEPVWTLSGSTEERGKDLPKLLKQQRCVAFFGCDQVDAAADGEAEAKLDDSDGARVQRRREVEEEMKRQQEEKERDPHPYL